MALAFFGDCSFFPTPGVFDFWMREFITSLYLDHPGVLPVHQSKFSKGKGGLYAVLALL
jgi:hypothetical protein